MYGMLGAVKVLEEEGTLMQNEHALTNEVSIQFIDK